MHGLQHARPPCSSLSPSSLLTLVSTESVMLSNHLILYRLPLLLPSINLCAMPCMGQVIPESSDKTCSTGAGNGKPLPYSCLHPMLCHHAIFFLVPLALEALTFSPLFPAGLRILPISPVFFFFVPLSKRIINL